MPEEPCESGEDEDAKEDPADPLDPQLPRVVLPSALQLKSDAAL